MENGGEWKMGKMGGLLEKCKSTGAEATVDERWKARDANAPVR